MRQRKTNEEKELSGSKNTMRDQITSGELKEPQIPPPWMPTEAQRYWHHIVPTIEACEADRMILAILCTLNARFYNEKTYSEGPRLGECIVTEESRERITKQIMDISDKFGMNPLSRSRSGINKKTMGVKQRS